MSVTATLAVFCADRSHARGKIAHVVTFYRDERGVWTHDRVTRRTRSSYNRADGATPFKCKLCRRELAPDRRPLFAVLDHLAAQGCVDVDLAELTELASTFERSGKLAHP
jgi:hypothetical protein